MSETPPTRDWTCDRCGTTQTLAYYTQPLDWWRGLLYRPPLGHERDIQGPIDLCGPCAQALWAFLRLEPKEPTP